MREALGIFQNINGIRFADQFSTLQAALDDAGTTGAVVIPPYYSSTATYTNPRGICILDLRPGKLLIDPAHGAAVQLNEQPMALPGALMRFSNATQSPYPARSPVASAFSLYGTTSSPALT